jgi:hypothetical protein
VKGDVPPLVQLTLKDAVWPLSIVGVVVDIDGAAGGGLTVIWDALAVEALSGVEALSITVAQ